jgi:arylsulfatase
VDGKPFKVHLDGYNMVPYFTGEVKESPRQSLMYFSDDGDVMAVRVGDYKFNLALQNATTMSQWAQPFVKLRVPHIVNLRRDPFERADFNSNTYWDWVVDHVPQMYLMQEVVAEQIAGFAQFPPRQKPASFNLDTVMEQVAHATGVARSAGKSPSQSRG